MVIDPFAANIGGWNGCFHNRIRTLRERNRPYPGEMMYRPAFRGRVRQEPMETFTFNSG